jgi:hypothetical protein
LDVEHSIQAHRPTLTGPASPASYYIRPPAGLSAEAFIQEFEAIPGFADYRLTLVSILGLDTYHQPLIASDDFAKKYFHDNHLRIVRVVGKSDQAIEAMAAFVEALKRPFDARSFPHYMDFSISGYRPPEEGRATEAKLLFRPADLNLLMKVERLVSVHLEESNLGRDIGTARHYTRNQPPELILSSINNTPAGVTYLEALVNGLPRATPQEVMEATEAAQRTGTPTTADSRGAQPRFYQPQAVTITLTPAELKRKAVASLVAIMKGSRFAGGAELKVVQGGTAIEITFPRTISSLWLASSFDERKHIAQVTSACIGVRADPALRQGWSAQYHFDTKTGKLVIRAVDADSETPGGWKLVPSAE